MSIPSFSDAVRFAEAGELMTLPVWQRNKCIRVLRAASRTRSSYTLRERAQARQILSGHGIPEFEGRGVRKELTPEQQEAADKAFAGHVRRQREVLLGLTTNDRVQKIEERETARMAAARELIQAGVLVVHSEGEERRRGGVPRFGENKPALRYVLRVCRPVAQTKDDEAI